MFFSNSRYIYTILHLEKRQLHVHWILECTNYMAHRCSDKIIVRIQCVPPYNPSTTPHTPSKRLPALDKFVLFCNSFQPRGVLDQRWASTLQPCLMVTWDLVSNASCFLPFFSSDWRKFSRRCTYTGNYSVTALIPLRTFFTVIMGCSVLVSCTCFIAVLPMITVNSSLWGNSILWVGKKNLYCLNAAVFLHKNLWKHNTENSVVSKWDIHILKN